MSFCSCDTYSWPFRQATRKAAKPYRCGECGAPIKVGDVHEYVTGLCEGNWWQERICAPCKAVIDYAEAHVPCVCVEYQNALEICDEAIREYAHQVPGMGMEYGRLRIAVRGRKQKSGDAG